MQFLFIFLSIFFLYFNYKIIDSDIKSKLIPNKYLIYLLFLIPFWWGMIFLIFFYELSLFGFSSSLLDFNIWFFIIQIFLTFFISFILYYFGIWSAGDAKYLLVLSLFIPYIGVIPFIGNIALLTLFYLFLYFLYFYLIKNIFNHRYRKILGVNILNDLREKLKYFMISGDGKIYFWNGFFKILQFIIVFLIIFVSIRLSRIYILQNIFDENNNKFEFIQKILEDYHIYIFIVIIGIFIGLIYFIRYLIHKIKYFIYESIGNTKITRKLQNYQFIERGFLFIVFLGLLSFIIGEYQKDSEEILNHLYRIFTLYLIIYAVVKILIYSYKVTFQIGEEYYVNIEDLKEGDIIDKKYLINLFNTKNPENKEIMNNYYSNMDNIKSIDNNLKKDEITLLKNIFKKTNSLCKKDIKMSKGFNDLKYVKLLKTFSFGCYIFCGFIISYLLGNSIFEKIIGFFIEVGKNFYGGL